MADQEVSPAPVDNTTNTEEVTAAPEQPVEGQIVEQVTPASAAE